MLSSSSVGIFSRLSRLVLGSDAGCQLDNSLQPPSVSSTRPQDFFSDLSSSSSAGLLNTSMSSSSLLSSAISRLDSSMICFLLSLMSALAASDLAVTSCDNLIRFQRNYRPLRSSPYLEDTLLLYQDTLSLPVLHDRLPSTDKILFAFRPFYKQSQRWMTPTKKVQMHKESTNAQRWNVCTEEIRKHASDGIRAEKDKCTKYYSF